MKKRNSKKRMNRQQVMLSDTEVEILRDWQFDNRIPSMGAAIREAIRIGLEHGSDFRHGFNMQDEGTRSDHS